jgi:S1-C subfamily serine protease
MPGGAAEQAGLRAGTERAYLGNQQIVLGGDLIVSIDDHDIENQQDLAQAMNRHRAGDTAKVTIYRGKRKLTLNVVLGEARQQA